MEAQMTAGRAARPPGRTARRELILVLALGAAGAGLVLLAMRQGWAHIETAAPDPLPASVTTISGQALVPAGRALAVAALAGLAAILATRGTPRRIAGVVLAGFGAGIAAAVSAGIPAADVRAAASAGTGAGPGSAAGSTTAGTGAAGVPFAGVPGHVTFASFPWRGAALLGALAVIAAGALTAWRARRLPVMSGRFDRPSSGAAPGPAAGSGNDRDSASIWESLSRGEDPTGGD